MITNNLIKFNDQIAKGNKALFQIETILAVPDISLHLNPNEMTKLFLQSVRDSIESANYFTRWQDQSCKECPPVKVEGGAEESYLYTFYPDVVNRPEMRELASSIHNSVQKAIGTMKKHLLKFKKYKTLWKADKHVLCEKFAAKEPNVVAYDEKILFYYRTVEEVAQLPKHKVKFSSHH